MTADGEAEAATSMSRIIFLSLKIGFLYLICANVAHYPGAARSPSASSCSTKAAQTAPIRLLTHWYLKTRIKIGCE